ncbi:MAG TPA: cupredoxin family copper-binding protein [Anaerolineae bacterium]|nr:cupredoxin family copper-binding protein [Anaerolineae bacterium]
MQAILGTRGAANVNLVAEILILIGLYIGFYYARKRKFRPQHANIQTTMVLLNLVLILSIMVPSFYRYVIRSGNITDNVSILMIVHAILGTIAEGLGLYLVFTERFRIIPWRIRKLKPVMRSLLALWTIVVLLGIGIYYFSYIAPAPASASQSFTNAPLQYQVDTLLIHTNELNNAAQRASSPAVRRHTEHIINLLVGKSSTDYGDLDKDGIVEDPGDGQGLLNYLQIVHDEAAAANQERAAKAADTVRTDLLTILDNSRTVMATNDYKVVLPQIHNIDRLANQVAKGNNDSIPEIVQLLKLNTTLTPIASATQQSGTVTVNMQDFRFQPKNLQVKKGTTVVFVNKDNAKHTATDDNGAFNSKDIDAGQTFSFTFDTAGNFPYHCEYHGDKGGVDMAGVITVTEQ